MNFYNPYKNIFFYYRGPSLRNSYAEDTQIEDNTTKALINTLEASDKRLLDTFLKVFEIKYDAFSRIKYDLQVAKSNSRPDAAITLGDLEILIECKVKIPLTREQLLHHLREINGGYLLCITNKKEDEIIVHALKDKRIRFILWSEVYIIFEDFLKTIEDENSKFVIKQFLEYLEIINMSPFTGWNKKDFEAFLNIELDTNKELRLRVKDKFAVYIKALLESAKKIMAIEGHESRVGNVKLDSRHIWAVIGTTISNIINVPHFNFAIDSDAFSLGIQIEGKKPTYKTLEKIELDMDRVLKMLRDLNGYVFMIKMREEISVQKWKSFDLARINLNKELATEDVQYIIKKSRQYKYFEYRIAKIYQRDEKVLHNQSFLDESVNTIKQLKEFYDFVS